MVSEMIEILSVTTEIISQLPQSIYNQRAGAKKTLIKEREDQRFSLPSSFHVKRYQPSRREKEELEKGN